MVYFNTASLLRNAGYEVVFFSKRKEENLPCEQEEFFVEKAGKIEQISNYFYHKKAALQLEKLIAIEKPDIAHVHLIWGGLSPSVLEVLKKHRIPIVHTAHDYRMVCPAYLLKDKDGRFCERCRDGKFYNCAVHRCSKGKIIESLFMTGEMYYRNHNFHPVDFIDGFIFVSNFSKNKHIEFDNRFKNVKTTVLYNCPGENVSESLDLHQDTFGSYYLFYGRLSEEKGIHTLLNAFEKFPQLSLKIVGTGPLEMKLMTIVQEKRLSNVELLGYKTGKELFDLVSKAKYVCVPSECYENNPMTIVEAYSLAIPVIGAAIGGISEVVNDGQTGFLFNSGDIDSLVNAIGKTSSLDKSDYMLQKNDAYQFACDNFSRESHLKNLTSYYNEIINNYNG